MATTNFLYRSQKENAGLTLRLLFRHNEIDYVFAAPTKLIVSKNYWAKYHPLKRIKDIDILNRQNDINNEILKISNHILAAFNSVNPDVVNKTWLKLQLDYYYNPPKEENAIPTALTEYFDYYISYRKYNMAKTSVQKYQVIKKKLIELQEIRKSIILVKDVNDKFKNEFVEFYHTRQYAQNTIQREFSFLKTVCKHARFMGIETSTQLDSLSLDKEKTDTIYLDFNDLYKIENIKEGKLTPSLENARDWLVISCYCGQRVSDFMRFTPQMIRIEQGKSLIEFTQKKTKKIMTIPVLPKVMEILKKRDGNFPYPISEQRYNEFIKEVCKIAEINTVIQGNIYTETAPNSKIYRKEKNMYEKWRLVTSHIGRRSFATNFYGDILTIYLKNITGHSTETMFLNYIGKSNKDLALEMLKYF